MKRKFVPSADSELLSGNYHCRFVRKSWEPRYENRNFNLNESRRWQTRFCDADEARTPKGTAVKNYGLVPLPAPLPKESPPPCR